MWGLFSWKEKALTIVLGIVFIVVLLGALSLAIAAVWNLVAWILGLAMLNFLKVWALLIAAFILYTFAIVVYITIKAIVNDIRWRRWQHSRKS